MAKTIGWLPKLNQIAQDIGEEEEKEKQKRQLQWWEYPFEPFRWAGQAVAAPFMVTPEMRAETARQKQELLARLAAAKTEKERQAIRGEAAREAFRGFAPGGRIREKYEQLPFYAQLGAELPSYMAVPSAMALRAGLPIAKGLPGWASKILGKPPITGITTGAVKAVLGTAGRAALTPMVGAEYAIALPFRGVGRLARYAGKGKLVPKRKVPPVTPEVTTELRKLEKWEVIHVPYEGWQVTPIVGGQPIIGMQFMYSKKPTGNTIAKLSDRLMKEGTLVHKEGVDYIKLPAIPKAVRLAAPEVRKQTWQMTQSEYIATGTQRGQKEVGQYTLKSNHRQAVKNAIEDGQPVPAAVLKDYPDLAKAIPKAEAGMPEAGIQAGMMGVPGKVVRPEPTGRTVQAGMEDYLRLQQYEARVGKITDQLTELESKLAAKGRLPRGETKSQVKLRRATLEAQSEIEAAKQFAAENNIVARSMIEDAKRSVETELGNRSLPFHGRAAGNLFPDRSSKELDQMLKIYNKELEGLAPITPGVEAQAALPSLDVEPAQKLLKIIDATKVLLAETKQLRGVELSKRVAKAAKVLETGEGPEAFIKAKAALKGALPKTERMMPELAEVGIVERDIEGLYNWIRVSQQQFFTKLEAESGLTKILTYEVPQKHEIEALNSIFGADFSAALATKPGLAKRAFNLFLDIMNLPRALKTTLDQSYVLRQAALLVPLNLKQTAQGVVAGFKIMLKPRYAEYIDGAMRTNKYYQIGVDAALDLPRYGSLPTQAEEAFISRLYKYIPFLRRFEKVYVVGLNQIRSSVFYKWAAIWEKEGATVPFRRYESLAEFINLATGRMGRRKMPRALRSMMPALNAVFFSPQLQASRITLPFKIFTMDPVVRKIAIKNVVAYIGGWTTLLGLLAATGAIKVELDARSSDFGKIRIGNIRIDPWGGFQQYVRFFCQLITGIRKTTEAYPRMTAANREYTFMRFIRSKESPAFALAHDILAGQTFVGEELALTSEGVRQQLFDRLTPFFIQDVIEAMQSEGLLPGTVAIIPGWFGMGVQTFRERGLALPKLPKRMKLP